jgi:hypothetical protein
MDAMDGVSTLLIMEIEPPVKDATEPLKSNLMVNRYHRDAASFRMTM